MMEFGFLDTNREARFESMRRQSRSAQVLRRHEDLRKQCLKEVKLYERSKRLMTAHCKRSQMQCMGRMKTLYHYCPSYLRGHTSFQNVAASADRGFQPDAFVKPSVQLSPSSEPSHKSGPSKERFLFRVLHRNGKEVYIRDKTEAQESRKLLNRTRDEENSLTKQRRTQH